jgi:GNAT superfamily N-acetyltransferase
VASISGTIIGFARTRATADEVIELDDLFVDPDWQRQGAARSLMQALVREAVHERVTRIEVTANQHTLGFYHAMGFVGDLPTSTTLGSGLRMHLDVAAVR